MSEPIDIRSRYPLRVSDVKVCPPEYAPDLKEILITEYRIKKRVAELAFEISDNYRQRADQENLLAICILEGAKPFFEDLTSHLVGLGVGIDKEYLKVSSYDGTKSTGEVKLGDFDFEKVRGRRVLTVEDIVETRRSLTVVENEILARNSASLEFVCLLDKPEYRNPKYVINIDYLGFIIPDKFVVGYGLDLDEEYRDLNHIGVLTKEAIERAKREKAKEEAKAIERAIKK